MPHQDASEMTHMALANEATRFLNDVIAHTTVDLERVTCGVYDEAVATVILMWRQCQAGGETHMHAHLSIPRLLGAVAYHMPRPHMA